MKKVLLTLCILTSFTMFSQDILMQTTTVSQCGGVFYDSGGPSANYGMVMILQLQHLDNFLVEVQLQILDLLQQHQVIQQVV